MKKIPQEYLGEETIHTEYTKTAPRKWTEKEIDWCMNLHKEGYSYKDIAESVGRTEISVSIKMKRLTKKSKTYNKRHVQKKYKLNNEFFNYLNPKNICDVYSGDGYWNKLTDNVVTNDKDRSSNAQYNFDALKFLCYEYFHGNKYDLVDLDPYGSAYECFDLAIKIAKKGLIITLGELGHKRFKRLDFVKTHYGINKDKDFTVDNLIKHIQQIGLQNKKELRIYKVGNWNLISRVYFTIHPYKVTEQWDK